MADDEKRPATPKTAALFTTGVVLLLLTIHFALANAAHWNKSGTFDEASHIANGYSSLVTGDYRMFPVSLFNYRWITTPLYFLGVEVPSTDQELWWHANNWEYGRQLLYGLGNDGQMILRVTRAMTSLFSVMLGVIVFLWSRKLFGTTAAFVSLTLYAFNPSVLANGALAATDMAAALAFTSATWTLWNVLERLSAKRLLLSGVVWGCAFCTKFSLLLM